MKSVFIVGSEGTTGLRLKNRLEKRSDIELLEIDPQLRKNSDEIAAVMAKADFTFLCLPDEAAREIAGMANSGTRIIDTSTAHRTDDGWAYGFPELSADYRRRIQDSARVSSPGCHSSGFIALVAPLINEGILNRDAALSCTSLTGYSGGGKKMIAQYEAAERGEEYKSSYLYAMGQGHKHLPEMLKHTQLATPPSFIPVVGDYYAGMLVTVPLSQSTLKARVTRDELISLYKSHYSEGRMVKVSPDAPAALYASGMAGRDDMVIYVTGSEDNLLLSAAFDNLGKGASGAAIQCFNIMCGISEETGLVVG